MAIAFDSISGMDTTGASVSVSHTCSGSDRILFACVLLDGNRTVTDVTYNGVSFVSNLVGENVQGTERVAIYYLTNPATGSNTLQLTCSGSNNPSIRGVSYTGAAQTGQPDNTVNASATATNLNNTLTTIADNCWHMAIQRNTANAVGAGTSTTLRGAGGANGVFAVIDNNAAITPPGSHTINGTGSGSQFMYQVGVSFSPPAATNIKTINGLARASVKTVNDLAIASVKSWNGLI